MYSTELILNQENLFAKRDVASRYEMHRSVAHLTEGATTRVLWRLDMQSTWRLTIQCEWPLEPQYVSRSMPGYAVSVRSAEVNRDFQEGDLLLFQLEANPTAERANKRRALLEPEDLRSWLERHVERAGCELINHVVLSRQAHQSYRKERLVTLNGVRFKGVLKVDDPKGLGYVVESGVGSAKGYGFGLLSLKHLERVGHREN